MRRVVKLRTDDGEKIDLILDNWACGVDRLYRRWVREPDGWHCLETQKRANRRRLGWGLLFGRNPKPLGASLRAGH